ncbi:MAG: hypothetical protein J6T16_08080, partial [Opitutales bacterium]|nr:hypothetical protein [Opitutales bacterium]
MKKALFAGAAVLSAALGAFAQSAPQPPQALSGEDAELAKARELEKKFSQTEAERVEEEKQKRREFFLESEKRRKAELEKRLEAERKEKRGKYKKSIFSGLKGSAPELVADSPIDYDVESGQVVAKDNARLSDANFEISADRIEFNSKTGKASAKGNVAVTQENARVLSDGIFIDIRNSEFSSEYLRMGFYPMFAEAESVSTEAAANKKDKKVKAREATFYVGEPSFLSLNVKGEEFSYDAESEYAELRNAYLRLGPVPFMYVPYYGQQGLDSPPIILQTRVGYNGDYGFKWQNTVLYSGFDFVAPGALLDIYTKRGVLV